MSQVVLDNPIDIVITEAKRYINVQEVPKNSNRGTEIDYWLKEVGVPFGNPWCAAFISQVGRQALGHGWPVIATASVQTMVNWGRAYLSDEPQKGDLFVLYFPSLSRFGHVGLVTDVLEDSYMTIEGNTNTDGSRDGYGVFVRKRKKNDQTKFIRWVNSI